ncbi:MAG: GerW family sporulation protein [Eubacteriales bacterium]|nr:GerW family sporulation protein [Eubacteriales bacterium]
MDPHPIENIMTTTMENIRDMVDVNTVIGDAITTQDGSTIIPISRVSFGFVAGGGEYSLADKPKAESQSTGGTPFAGGTGAGVTVQPVGFLVTNAGQVRLLPAQHYAPLDRIIEMLPQAMSDIKSAMCSCKEQKKDVSIPVQPEA